MGALRDTFSYLNFERRKGVVVGVRRYILRGWKQQDVRASETQHCDFQLLTPKLRPDKGLGTPSLESAAKMAETAFEEGVMAGQSLETETSSRSSGLLTARPYGLVARLHPMLRLQNQIHPQEIPDGEMDGLMERMGHVTEKLYRKVEFPEIPWTRIPDGKVGAAVLPQFIASWNKTGSKRRMDNIRKLMAERLVRKVALRAFRVAKTGIVTFFQPPVLDLLWESTVKGRLEEALKRRMGPRCSPAIKNARGDALRTALTALARPNP
jgi:hypothetical protein